MKTLERSTVKDLSADIQAALQAVALKHGVKFTPKGCSFSPSNATFRIEAAVIGDGGVAETRERTDFTNYATQFGLKPEWLDKSFLHGAHNYVIVGLATRKSKPVLATKLGTDRTYMFPANTVATLMNAQHPTPVTA